MILTVTLNAALDITYWLNEVVLGETCRVTEVQTRAGGKAVDVARILDSLGYEVIGTGLLGQEHSSEFITQLGDCIDEFELVPGRVRRATTLVEVGGRTTNMAEPGPTIKPASWRSFVERYSRLVKRNDVNHVVIAGSAPPGTPRTGYRELVAISKQAGCYTVLDASGRMFLEGIKAGPDMIKPNADEVAEAVGYPVTHDNIHEAVEDLRGLGAQDMVISLGSEGMLGVRGAMSRTVRPPRVVGNPTGAGDAVVAGVVDGLVSERGWDETLQRAAAFGAAAVLAPVAGEISPRHVAELLPRVELS